MVNDERKQGLLDVAVIGGGPAGISASLELAKFRDLNIALFESEPEIGGIPRSCHIFFGMRDLKRIYNGPSYARKLRQMIRKTSVRIHTQSKVLNIIAGSFGKPHCIEVSSPEGMKAYQSRFILLATGCFESSVGSRFIPGTRPAGVFTARTLQAFANTASKKPANRALIIGSERVALSCVITLKNARTEVAGIVEKDPELHVHPYLANAMSLLYGFPVYKDTLVKSIFGYERVEGVELVRRNDQSTFTVECDCIVISGKFRPDSVLIENTPIERDPLTLGPLIDANFMTSVPDIFAAGNVIRGADMHDLCALEGRIAAKNILKRLHSNPDNQNEGIFMRAQPPIRYVIPQIIFPNKIKHRFLPQLKPVCSIQVDHTITGPILEAWSGNEIIWVSSFRKWFGNHRICLPLEKFNWSQVDTKNGITFKLRDS